MKEMHKILEIVYRKNTEENWDTVWLVCGDEGTGKSYFDMHILDWWYTKMNGAAKPEDVKHMCMTTEMFRKDLGDMQKYEATNYDEGGALSNRRFMANFNFEITQAFQVIRGDGLFTIITLPDPFDLDPFFLKRRVRGFVYIYKRQGKTSRFAFWSKSRFRKLVALNSDRKIKSMTLVVPTYYRGYCPEYTGVLLEPYLQLKAQKIAETRAKFREGTLANKVDKEKELLIKFSQAFGQKRVAEVAGVSTRTIQRYQNELLSHEEST